MSDVLEFPVTLGKGQWDGAVSAWRLDPLRDRAAKIDGYFIDGKSANPDWFRPDAGKGLLRWVREGEAPPAEVTLHLMLKRDATFRRSLVLAVVGPVIAASVAITLAVVQGCKSSDAPRTPAAPSSVQLAAGFGSTEMGCLRGYAPHCVTVYTDARDRCRAGNASSCTLAAAMLQVGRHGVPKDLSTAQDFYDKACAANDPEGCYGSGLMYLRGLVITDLDRAFSLFDKACKVPYWPACTNKGLMLENGQATSRNIGEALKLYKSACEHDEMTACSNLGRLLRHGIAVRPDVAQALKLYKSACDAGVGRACRNLGMLYEEGTDGVTQNYGAAVDLYKRACELGEAIGCTAQGNLVAEGLGVTPDLRKAFDLFKAGCDDGDAVGCNNVGDAYEHGHGTEQSVAKAFTYYDLACQRGVADACESIAAFMRDGRLAKDEETARRYDDKAIALRKPSTAP